MEEFQKFNELPTELRLKIWKYTLPGPRIVELKKHPIDMTVNDWQDENNATHRGDIFAAAGIVGPSLNDVINCDLAAIYRDYKGVGTPLDDQDTDSGHLYLCGYTSDSPPPAALFVCRESHEVASEYYQKSFFAFGSIPETWFNFDIDTLYLSMDSLRGTHDDDDDDDDGAKYVKIIVSILDRLKSLIEEPPQKHYLQIFEHLQSLQGFQRLEDMRRVKHLAISIDDLHIECFEDSIIDYLEVFTGLSTLTIVANHWDGEVIGARCHPDQEPDDSSDLSLMELFDADKAYEIYRKIERNPSLRMPSRMADNSSVPPLDLEKLRNISDYRSKNFPNQSHGTGWKFPKIEYKVAITGGWKAYLDELRTRCEILNAEADERQKNGPISWWMGYINGVTRWWGGNNGGRVAETNRISEELATEHDKLHSDGDVARDRKVKSGDLKIESPQKNERREISDPTSKFRDDTSEDEWCTDDDSGTEDGSLESSDASSDYESASED